MSNYTKATNFAIKDGLVTTDPAKIIKGTEIDNEYNAISSAISSKADVNSPALTGTPTAPTATSGSNNTQLATTAFVTGAVTDTATATTTFTNKTINLTSNTLAGTVAQFNTALSDGDFATIAGTETLTNKTLTSPTITTPSISSPAMSGTPTAPTASVGTNTTQIATTAFVLANAPSVAVIIPTGTVILFYQSAAPTGWTQVTTLNDYDLRLVSGTGGTTGGTTAYSTVFSNQTVSTTISGTSGATTLSTAQMPSHTHGAPTGLNGGEAGSSTFADGTGFTTIGITGATGGGGSHTHSFSATGTSSAVTLNVRYANIIICSKN